MKVKRMELLEKIESEAKHRCPCCRPVYKDGKLLINEPPIQAGTGAHQRWIDLKDYLDTNYDEVKVIKNKYQLEVTAI